MNAAPRYCRAGVTLLRQPQLSVAIRRGFIRLFSFAFALAGLNTSFLEIQICMVMLSNTVKKEGAEKPSRILCLEDNHNDRELLELTLLGEGMACEFVYARTRQEFEGALGQ